MSDMVKRTGHILLLALALAGVAPLSSCHRDPVPADDSLTVEFSLADMAEEEGVTRVQGGTSLSSNEQRINRWAVYVFNSSGNYVTHGTQTSVSNNSTSIRKTLAVGTYTVCAVVNYPTGWTPPSNVTLNSLKGTSSSLADNSATSLVMFGQEDNVSITATSTGKAIRVYRLVARLGIQSIRVQMTSAFYASQPFLLKGVYVTNVMSETTFGTDANASSSTYSNRNMWYNTMGWMTSGSRTNPACPQAIVGDRGLGTNGNGVSIAQNGTYSTAHYFYVCPNTYSGTDTHAATWSRRRTRIIIEGTIGGVTYYWQVNVQPQARNNSYVLAQATITRPGSTDPEQEAPGSLDLVFDTTWPSSGVDSAGWNSQQITVTETS